MRSLAFVTRASLFVLLAASLGGCFVPKEPECAFSCDYAAAGPCPSGYTCLADGFCYRGDHTGPCTAFPQQDGRVLNPPTQVWNEPQSADSKTIADGRLARTVRSDDQGQRR